MNKTKSQKGQLAFKKGIWAERWVHLILRLKGYTIHETRFKTKWGEIDLIASDKNVLIFIEVKARDTYEVASYAITPHQQKRWWQAAQFYLMYHPTVKEVRFDVFLVKPRSFPLHLRNVLWSEP